MFLEIYKIFKLLEYNFINKMFNSIFCNYAYSLKQTSIFHNFYYFILSHNRVSLLGLRKMVLQGRAMPFATYKHSVKTRLMLALH
jgi:hypothetical protein